MKLDSVHCHMLYFKCSIIELGVDELYSANVGQRSNTVSNIRFGERYFYWVKRYILCSGRVQCFVVQFGGRLCIDFYRTIAWAATFLGASSPNLCTEHARSRILSYRAGSMSIGYLAAMKQVYGFML